MKLNWPGVVFVTVCAASISATIAMLIWVGMSLLPRGEIIWQDGGGPIAARAAVIRLGNPVEIAGTCASACTMHLANGCVRPGAVLIFHGPQTVTAFDHFSALMARHYPPAIAAWFMAVGRFGEYQMTGAEAIRLGARICETRLGSLNLRRLQNHEQT